MTTRIFRHCIGMALAVLLLGNSAHAIEDARASLIAQVAQASKPSAAFNRDIEIGILATGLALDAGIRDMRLCKSPLIPKASPPSHIDAVIRAVETMAPLIADSGRVMDFGILSPLVLSELTTAGYSTNELQPLRNYLRSPDGRRAMAVGEATLAASALSGLGADVYSGESWDWPYARVLQYMEAAGFKSEFLAAADRVGPGTSKLFPLASSAINHPVRPDVAGRLYAVEWGGLPKAFRESLSERDAALLADPRMQRYFTSMVRAMEVASQMNAVHPHGVTLEQLTDQLNAACLTTSRRACAIDARKTIDRLQPIQQTTNNALADVLQGALNLRIRQLPVSGCPEASRN